VPFGSFELLAHHRPRRRRGLDSGSSPAREGGLQRAEELSAPFDVVQPLGIRSSLSEHALDASQGAAGTQRPRARGNEAQAREAIERTGEREARIPDETSSPRWRTRVRVALARCEREPSRAPVNVAEDDEEVFAKAERAPQVIGTIAAPGDRTDPLEDARVGPRSPSPSRSARLGTGRRVGAERATAAWTRRHGEFVASRKLPSAQERFERGLAHGTIGTSGHGEDMIDDGLTRDRAEAVASRVEEREACIFRAPIDPWGGGGRRGRGDVEQRRHGGMTYSTPGQEPRACGGTPPSAGEPLPRAARASIVAERAGFVAIGEAWTERTPLERPRSRSRGAE
jgi:hypothetical protein